jgi:hypothetical protein
MISSNNFPEVIHNFKKYFNSLLHTNIYDIKFLKNVDLGTFENRPDTLNNRIKKHCKSIQPIRQYIKPIRRVATGWVRAAKGKCTNEFHL